MINKVGIYEDISVRLCIIMLLLICLCSSCHKSPINGQKIDMGDFKLYVQSLGTGSPNIIIEGGLNCKTEYYNKLQKDLSKYSRVISYDHAGLGRSTANSNPRTLPYYISELRGLIDSLELEPPYILVGHSLGGHIVRYFTYLYPEEVAGLVFLDHPHEDWFRYIRSTWSPEEVEHYFEWWNPEINKQGYEGTGLIELAEYEANCDSIRGKEIPSDIPVLMFTGNNRLHFRRTESGISEDKIAWADMQHSLIKQVEDANQIVDWEAGHAFHNDKPELVELEIGLFIDSIQKTNTLWQFSKEIQLHNFKPPFLTNSIVDSFSILGIQEEMKFLVQGINELNADMIFSTFSKDKDAKYRRNGYLYSSIQKAQKNYSKIFKEVDFIAQDISFEDERYTILKKNVVLMTATGNIKRIYADKLSNEPWVLDYKMIWVKESVGWKILDMSNRW